jgi:hypothetical protein
MILSQSEADAIERQAEPSRVKVREMFAKYRPTLGRSNGDGQPLAGEHGINKPDPALEDVHAKSRLAGSKCRPQKSGESL